MPKRKKLKLLYVLPDKNPKVEEIDYTYGNICNLLNIDWYLHRETIYLDEKKTVCILHNCLEVEDGKELVNNREVVIPNDDPYLIKGPFIVVGCKDRDYCSLSEEQLKRYATEFSIKK